LSWVGEYIGHHRDGHQFPVYANDAPVFDNGGQLVAIISASHDISAEKNAKEDLHKSLDRTATILESISDSFTALDRDWRITFMNQLALMYKGLSTGDVVGKTIWDVFPDLAGTQLEEVYHDVMTTRLPRTCINESVVSQGRIFEIHVYPMGDGGISIFGQEITERVQAEAALRESEKRFRELAETAGSIILRFDTQGRITYFNQFAETFFGFSRDEILGKPAVGTIIPYRDSWGRDMEMMIRDIVAHPKQYEDNENENTRKNGERVWVRWTNKPIFNPDGTIREFTTIGNDITSQKHMEQALQASETRYRLAVQATNDAIWDLDIATGSVHWNDTYAVLYGRPPDSTGSWQWWIDHIHPDDRDRVLGGIQSAINGSESRWAAEYRFLKADGEWAYISDRAHIARDTNGNPWRVIGAMQDLTDRKRVEVELKRRHDELNETNAALVEAKEELNSNIVQLTRRESELKDALAEKEILLSEIHHRVKNNLAAFISLLSLDGTYEKTDAGQMLRQDLQNRARSMALIHETLYRTGKFSSVNMEVYLTTLIGQVARSYAGKTPVRTIVDAKGVTLDLARATTAGLIINELVTNSFKYAFPPGFDCQKERNEPCTVRVVFSCGTGEHRLTVSDNGTGLPPEIDPRTAKSLGLKLVTFLAKHQLRADIEVRADKGTSFIFNLNKPENNP
jgi:PAS domain S-box-containing protein